MQISQIIGERYELHTRIGQGRMGAVYLAQDTETEKMVAVKALHEDILNDEAMRERFRREGEALRRLQHPAIVTLLDYVVTDTQDYLVLEYMAGGTLRDVLMETPQLPLPRFLQLARDLSAALTYAHNSHILHRDIKPGNVLMANDGTPRLTDFSVAQLGDRTRMTETGVIIGTSAYVSPEIYSNHPADERSDIWSLGVLFYEMLTGELPFQGEHVTAMLLAILSQNPPDILQKRPDAPAALVNLIYMMLLKDPDDRLQTMQRVHDEIVALIQGTPSNLPKILPMDTPSQAAKNIIQALSGSWQNKQNLMEDTDSLENLRPTDETHEKSKPKAKPRNLWQWIAIALSAILLLISGGLASTLLNSNAAAAVPIPDPAQTAEVALASVGQPGQGGGQPAAPSGQPGQGQPPLGGPPQIQHERGIVMVMPEDGNSPTMMAIESDLKRVFDATYQLKFIPYSGTLASSDAAGDIARDNQATLVIWGNPTDDDSWQVQMRVLMGPEATSNAINNPTFDDLAILTLIIQDAETESSAPYVAGLMALYYLNQGDLYEFARYLTFIADFDAPLATLMDANTSAAHVQRVLQAYAADAEEALAELEAALALGENNALLLTLRGLIQNRAKNLIATRQDIDTVRQMSPNYSVPTQLDMMLALINGSNPRPYMEQIRYYNQAVPTAFGLMLQGLGVYHTDRYLDSGNLLRHAVDIAPDIAYAYAPLVALAYMNANIEEATTWIEQARANLKTDNNSNRLLEVAFGTLPIPNIYNHTSAALTHLVNAEWTKVPADLEEILVQAPAATVENYLILGLAYCNLGDYAAAEMAYTTGIEKGAPPLDLLLLLRAEAHRAQGHTAAADADIVLARSIPGRNPAQWQALVEDFAAGEMTCTNLFAN